MRGDLEQIILADIFQTLALSKMEGMLRVRNPLEQREIFFREGLVRCMVPARVTLFQHSLKQSPQTDHEELVDVTAALVDALRDEGRWKTPSSSLTSCKRCNRGAPSS